MERNVYTFIFCGTNSLYGKTGNRSSRPKRHATGQIHADDREERGCTGVVHMIYIGSAQRPPRECTTYRTEPHADSLHDLAATSTPQLSCSCKSRTWGKLQVARRARRVSSAHTDHRSKTALTGHHPCCKAHTARRRAPRASAASTACTRCSTWRTRSRCTNWAPATGCARRSHRGGAQPYETHR